MAKHRRRDAEPTEIFDVRGELDRPDTFEEEYKPRRYEEYVGEITQMKNKENPE